MINENQILHDTIWFHGSGKREDGGYGTTSIRKPSFEQPFFVTDDPKYAFTYMQNNHTGTYSRGTFYPLVLKDDIEAFDLNDADDFKKLGFPSLFERLIVDKKLDLCSAVEAVQILIRMCEFMHSRGYAQWDYNRYESEYDSSYTGDILNRDNGKYELKSTFIKGHFVDHYCTDDECKEFYEFFCQQKKNRNYTEYKLSSSGDYETEFEVSVFRKINRDLKYQAMLVQDLGYKSLAIFDSSCIDMILNRKTPLSYAQANLLLKNLDSSAITKDSLETALKKIKN